jgi:cytochrome c oxidase subunit III
MSARNVIDVSELPEFAIGRRDTIFWGVTLMILIESTVFALLVGSYFYIRGNDPVWPIIPPGVASTREGAIALFLLLVSAVPMARVNKEAEKHDLLGMRRNLLLGTVLGGAALVFRSLEISHLQFRWDSNAHGSVFWMTIGLHTMHTIASTLENALFLALLYIGPVEKKHLSDVYANGIYWFFVVVSWALLYPVLYLEFLVVR